MGLEVVGIDNFSNGYAENLVALKGDPDFRLVRGDILRLSGVTKPLYRGGISWPGDVQRTQADISKLKTLGFTPKFGLEEGLRTFMDWYKLEYGTSENRKLFQTRTKI